MKSKFAFYEVVKVVSKKPEHQDVVNHIGVIIGMSGTNEDEDLIVNYRVNIINANGNLKESDYFEDGDIVSLNKKTHHDIFMANTTIKVKTDLKTGEGSITGVVETERDYNIILSSLSIVKYEENVFTDDFRQITLKLNNEVLANRKTQEYIDTNTFNKWDDGTIIEKNKKHEILKNFKEGMLHFGIEVIYE